MKVTERQYTIGVIVGRFQLASLHEAHRDLIQTVLDKHPKVLLLLGLSPLRGTINDPLDFQPRKQMILEEFPPSRYPNLTIGYIKDQHDDAIWSEKLDATIKDQVGPSDTVVLYGSRDSFLPYYQGKFDCRELQSERVISGSEIRAQIAAAPQSAPLFRAGAIWATHQRFPTVYSTVDIAVINTRDLGNGPENTILMARKPTESQYRFVGGFVDIKDESIEHAALRELYEETGLTVGLQGLKYVGTARVDDWRYRKNPAEKIMTHLFVGQYSHGSPTASDDISEVRWFPIAQIFQEFKTLVVPTHHILVEKLIAANVVKL